MFPWKMLFRFFSATVLFATGGFAAGHDLPMPFDTAPPEVAAPAPVTDPVDTTTTTAPVDESTTTTTTTAPDTPVVEPVPVDPTTLDPAPTAPTTAPTTKPTKPAVGVPAPADTPPAAPVDGDAPAVCAAASAKVCGPTEAAAPAAPAADNSHQARVERCQDWWNSLAQAFDQNGRPEWATRARAIADRCDAMITRWEEAQKRWEERRQAKGDHNNDGRPDNGWGSRRDGRDDRPREAKTAKFSRHGEGRH
jgi:hypothetical protein